MLSPCALLSRDLAQVARHHRDEGHSQLGRWWRGYGDPKGWEQRRFTPTPLADGVPEPYASYEQQPRVTRDHTWEYASVQDIRGAHYADCAFPFMLRGRGLSVVIEREGETMRVCRVVLASLMAAASVVISVRAPLAYAGAVTGSVERATVTARETARLYAHFDSVDAELRAATPRNLRASQRAARAQLMLWLREYRNAALFPENNRFAAPTPFFVDHRGIRCAMGELLYRSGRDDIVRDVQRARNNAYIAQLVDDPRLVAWLDSVGMTAAEAARVQPSYDGSDGNIIDDVVVSPSPKRYRVLAGTLSAASVATIVLNTADHRPTGLTKWAGLAVGTAAVVTGVAERSNSRNDTKTYASASVFLGAASFAVAAYRVFAPASKAMVSSAGRRFDVAPTVLQTADGRSRAGLALRARFR